MSELGERQWAVISERGCEASGLKHREAAELARRLLREKISGVCVVTDEAARRLLAHQETVESESSEPAGARVGE
jgi:hypothetical protein